MKWGWGGGSGGLPFVLGLCGLQWEFPFLFSFFLSFKKKFFFLNQKVILTLSGEPLKATHLRSHMLQSLVGREQSSWFLSFSLTDPLREGQLIPFFLCSPESQNWKTLGSGLLQPLGLHSGNQCLLNLHTGVTQPGYLVKMQIQVHQVWGGVEL